MFGAYNVVPQTAAVAETEPVVDALGRITELEVEVERLNSQIRSLEYQKGLRRLGRDEVRTALIELAVDCAGETEISQLDESVFDSLNSTLRALNLDTVQKTFNVEVEVLFRVMVEVEVEANSFDEVINAIENGDYDDDLRGEADLHGAEIEGRDSISEV